MSSDSVLAADLGASHAPSYSGSEHNSIGTKSRKSEETKLTSMRFFCKICEISAGL